MIKISRIFDALKRAQFIRAGGEKPKSPVKNAVHAPERRRSARLSQDVSVYVYGHASDKEPFHEEAHTLNVSATGALLLLSVPVWPGQVLLLTNELTQREQDCRVVFLGKQHSRTVEAGVAFATPNPDFWQSHPPPQDARAV